MTVELGILLAIIGCFVGLAGWLSGRDKKIANDGEWRGGVDAKLDAIRQDIGGVNKQMQQLADTVGKNTDMLGKHGERLTAVEECAKSAHKRIDELKKGGGA